MSISITVVGLREYERYLDAAPENATTAARIALNAIARSSLKKEIPEAIYQQVAFPTGYLATPDRLEIDRPATNNELTTSIVARERPTSLARFATGLASLGSRQTAPVTVTVKPGQPRHVNRDHYVFGVRLNAGVDNVDNFNVGLAIRLKPGEVLARRNLGNDVPEIFPNVFLLYGPSVAQVFDDVAEEISDVLGDNIENEFLRQYVRLTEDGALPDV